MKPLSQINVIPFIDIMLVLLAVVLTTATFVVQGKIPVSLPDAPAAEPIASEPAVEITIDERGGLFLDDEPATLDAVGARLETLGRDTPLRLRVDEATPFRHFVAVVDRAKALGFENLSIITRRDSR